MKQYSFFGIILAVAALATLFASYAMVRASGGPAEADLWASGSNAASFILDEGNNNTVVFEWCGAGEYPTQQHNCANADQCHFSRGSRAQVEDGTSVFLQDAVAFDYAMWWGGPVSPTKGPYTLSCGSNGVGVTFDTISLNTRPVAGAVANSLGDGNPNGQTLPSSSVTVYRGYSVGFDGAGSSDRDSDALTYRWNCSGGILMDDNMRMRPSWNYNGAAPVGNYTCDLTVNDGSVSSNNAARVNITVTNPPSTTADIRARGNSLLNEDGPITGASGANVWLTWTSANATSCTGTNFSTGGATQNTSGVLVNPTANTTYSITCTGAFGPGFSDSVTVNIAGLPEADIRADSVSVVSGNSTTIRWCGTDSHVCARAFSHGCSVGTSPGGTSIQNNVAGGCSGSAPTGNLTSNTTYYLTATGEGGTSRSSVTVTVGPAAPVPPVAPSVSASVACAPLGTQVWITNQTGPTYDVQRCVGAGCTNFSDVATGVAAQPGGQVFLDTGAAANGTTYQYRARAINTAGPGGYSSPASLTFSDNSCAANPLTNLQTRDEAGTTVLINTPTVAGGTTSGTLKASRRVQFYIQGGEITSTSFVPNVAMQCSVSGEEYVRGASVREHLVSGSCSGSACFVGAGALSDLSLLQPDAGGNPIDELRMTGVCGIGTRFQWKHNTIHLRPGDFSLSPPTNICEAAPSASAPVTLSWNASPAAARYNAFRVIDANNDGVVQQSEIDTATSTNTYNLNVTPLLPASVCAGSICSWTDESARKNVHYLYFMRGRNANGTTFSDVPVNPQRPEGYRPRAITPRCAPAATLTPQTQTINFGNTAALAWSSSNADACTINQGVGQVCGAGLPSCDPGSGTRSVTPSVNTLYTLTCTGPGGPPAAPTSTVMIANRAPTAVAGVSRDPATDRVYANNIRVRQGEDMSLYFAPFV